MSDKIPTIFSMLHDIRNTYQTLLCHFDDIGAEGFKVDPEQARERMNKDLAVMREVEKSHKACRCGKEL